MSDNFVVTVGRQFGSGGHKIAKALGEKLGFKVYDKELLDIAAKDSGLSRDMIKNYDEKPTNSFLYSLSLGAYSFEHMLPGMPQMPIVDQVFAIQSDIIKKAADEGPCIIVGRCGDSILKDYPNLFKVFIHCDLDYRAKRVMEYENISYDEAVDMIKKSDKKRANYHNYFTDNKWGELQNYDLTFNGSIGVEKSVELLEFCIKQRMNK